MKKFSESLREHAMKITNFENKKMRISTNEQHCMKRQKFATFGKKYSNKNTLMIKIIVKLKTFVIVEVEKYWSGKVKHELRVTRVTSSNPRVTSSNPRVTSSNPRVRRLKAQVARLKARVGKIKARVRRLKARVEAIKPRVR